LFVTRAVRNLIYKKFVVALHLRKDEDFSKALQLSVVLFDRAVTITVFTTFIATDAVMTAIIIVLITKSRELVLTVLGQLTKKSSVSLSWFSFTASQPNQPCKMHP
jgi:hypothetical protein